MIDKFGENKERNLLAELKFMIPKEKKLEKLQ